MSKQKNIDYNVRIVRTPTGKLRLGFVHFLGTVVIEKSGPMKGSPCQTWKSAPAKFRKELAAAIGAKLI